MKAIKRGPEVGAVGWWLAAAALCTLFLAGVGGGPPLNELLAVGRDTVLPGGVPGAAVPGLSALDLFQLALALIVGMVFRRFLA